MQIYVKQRLTTCVLLEDMATSDDDNGDNDKEELENGIDDQQSDNNESEEEEVEEDSDDDLWEGMEEITGKERILKSKGTSEQKRKLTKAKATTKGKSSAGAKVREKTDVTRGSKRKGDRGGHGGGKRRKA